MHMTLTVSERKARLGRVGSKIARQTRRTAGHVAEVLNGRRRDPVVENNAARRLGIPVEQVFPEYYPEKETATQAATPE